jgi:predicted O-methyltransferase YrrM
MTLVILVEISGLIGYSSIILPLALGARDGRANCMKVLVY